MASISNLTLSVVKDVANAVITVEYDINWSSFDQATNLQYFDACKLIGDDTNQDGDEAVANGDDDIAGGSMPTFALSSNGQASFHRKRPLTIAFSNLDEDKGAAPFGDDEIRALVTLSPQLPIVTSRESLAVVEPA
jgi:hypothetical protein